ncbi:MAG: NUDIX hydrolase [Variovorax sp.]
MPQTDPNVEAHARVEPSASVILLRSAAPGMEVFLMRRASTASTYGGTYVFPGGKVDPEDSVPARSDRLDLLPQQMHDALGEPALTLPQATALHVAAARELHEEAGVLLAVSALAPWSRWITPLLKDQVRRRFDTRFFLARMPPDQTACVANSENTAGVWLSPRAAIERYWERAIELSPPQLMTLAHLARFDSAEAAFDHARRSKPPLVEPVLFEVDALSAFCYPGDDRHPVAARAFPGITRLARRDGRLEPFDGFEAFFD